MNDKPLGLTPAQLAAARVIHELTEAGGGVGPSYREIAAELDLASTGSAHRLVTALRDRGWLTSREGSARSIRLLRVPPPCEETEVAVTEAGRSAMHETARARGQLL